MDLLPFYVIRKSGRWSAPYALSLAGWFAFFYAIWGIPLPMAPYGALVQTSPLNLVFGAPGLFFDQEYGLLAFAPVYVLAATGLYQMWRAGGESKRQAIEIALVFGALLVTVGAFRIWWGGTSAPARPLASGLLLLAVPIATAFRVGAGRIGPPRRPAPAAVDQRRHRHHAGRGAGRPADQQRTRRHLVAARVLVAAVGTVDAGAHASSCTRPPIAWLHTLWWLAVAGGAGWFLARQRTTTPGARGAHRRRRRSASRC